MRHAIILAGLGLLLVLAASSTAEPVLRWFPSDGNVGLGHERTFSVMLDDTLTVRTIEIFVRFDPEVIATVDGGPGELFDGFNLFQGFVPDSINVWHGYAVILGAGDWTVGPGELFRWTVEGTAEGTSPVTTLSIILLPPGDEEYTEVELTDDQINVVSTTAALDVTPMLAQLWLYPNPFNPRTRVEMLLPGGGPCRLEVIDVRGRVVARPWSGTLGTTALTMDWDGRDQTGGPAPSGVYTFRLLGDQGRTASTRGVLVR